MKHIRTSALVAAVMIGSAAFAASVSADSSTTTSSTRQGPSFSASGSFAPPQMSGIAGDWQGDISLRIETASGSGYAGTFELPASQEGAAAHTGSLVAVENSDGTYSMTFTDMSTGASQTSLFTLVDGRMTGSISFDGASSEIRIERGHGGPDGRERPESTGSGATARTRPASDVTESKASSTTAKKDSSEKAPLSEKIRKKLDAKLDAVDVSKRQAFYQEFLRKLDILLAKSADKESQKALIEGVRDHIQSRLDAEFGTDAVTDDDAIEALLGQ